MPDKLKIQNLMCEFLSSTRVQFIKTVLLLLYKSHFPISSRSGKTNPLKELQQIFYRTDVLRDSLPTLSSNALMAIIHLTNNSL